MGRVNITGGKLPFKISIEKMKASDAFKKGEPFSLGVLGAWPVTMEAKKVMLEGYDSTGNDLGTTPAGITSPITADSIRLRRNANGDNVIINVRNMRTASSAGKLAVQASLVPDNNVALATSFAYELATHSTGVIYAINAVRLTDEIFLVVFYSGSGWSSIAVKYSTAGVFTKGSPQGLTDITVSDVVACKVRDMMVLILDRNPDASQASKWVPRGRALTVNAATLAITLGASVLNTNTVPTDITYMNLASDEQGNAVIGTGMSTGTNLNMLAMITVSSGGVVSFKPYFTITHVTGSQMAPIVFKARGKLYALVPNLYNATQLNLYEITYNGSFVITATFIKSFTASVTFTNYRSVSVVADKDADFVCCIPFSSNAIYFLEVSDNNNVVFGYKSNYSMGNNNKGCLMSKRLMLWHYSQIDYDFSRLYYKTGYFKINVNGFVMADVSAGNMVDVQMII